MNGQKDFTTAILVDSTPQQAFNAINNVRGWWAETIDGHTDRLGAEFQFHNLEIHRTSFKITEFIPNEKVTWHVLDNYFSFIKDQSEWKGTDVVFTITPKGDKTEVRFTHAGLVPTYECYEICSNAWGEYISISLYDLITTGKGHPSPNPEAVAKVRQMSQQ